MPQVKLKVQNILIQKKDRGQPGLRSSPSRRTKEKAFSSYSAVWPGE